MKRRIFILVGLLLLVGAVMVVVQVNRGPSVPWGAARAGPPATVQLDGAHQEGIGAVVDVPNSEVWRPPPGLADPTHPPMTTEPLPGQPPLPDPEDRPRPPEIAPVRSQLLGELTQPNQGGVP